MIAWKVNGVFKANPEAVYHEIETIGDSASPESIVEYAKNDRTELHKCFEWDDKIAGHKYRLEQARHILTLIVVKADDEEKEKGFTPVRIFVKSGDAPREYTKVNIAVRNEDAYQKLLENARRDAEAFMRKYENLPEVREIIEVIERFL